ncbi:lipopolysaccharide biosynthesis protein [Herpetosiphon giganteus]|uniref:lipopolysaccharide biosynthesis protein n=1 Tax=Herpetosiphon giganteus TaxID=2029754 RepID=UPI001957E7E3|nr:lipopolysaccharide biosynthesis protein [Herpetosiphon giganteus]MBM7841939.1 O-antigen/teichoic acid export membrane protein [Herpetosiphon giganteus]
MSRRLLKDTALYALTGVATKLIGALLLPFITRLLSPELYGSVDLISLVGLFAIELVTLGSDFALALYFHEATLDRRRLVGSLWLARLLLGLFMGLIGHALAPWLAIQLLERSDQQTILALRLGLWSQLANGIIGLWFTTLRQESKALRLFGLTVLRVAATALLTIGWMLQSSQRLSAYFGAMLVVDCLLALGLTLLMRGQLGKPDWQLLHPLLGKGLGFLPRSIYFVAMTLINRQILLHFGSLEQIGHYAAATKISFIVWIVISAANQAWLPYSLAIANTPTANASYRQYLTSYTMLLGAATTGLALFAPELLRILTTGDYLPAAPAVGWYAVNLMAIGLLTVVATGLTITKATAVLGQTSLLSAILNVGLAIMLVPWLGLVGAAIAAAGDQLIAAWLVYRAAQKRYPIDFDIKAVLAWLGLTIACVALASWLPLAFSWPLIGLKLALVGVWLGCCWRWGQPKMLLSLLRK